MKTKTVLLILFVAVVIAAVYGYCLYTAKPPAASTLSADLTIDATVLYDEFKTNEVLSDKRYNDKLLKVNGQVRDVVDGAGGTTDVLLETGDPLGAVVCEFSAGQKVEFEKNAVVSIKGFCAGLNLDVLLQRCSTAE